MLSFTKAAKTAAMGLILSAVSLTTYAGPVWFSDGKTLQRLDATTNQIALAVKADDSRSLIANADGSVWSMSKKRLSKYAFNGALIIDLDLKSLGLKSADHAALDSRDGSLWVAEGKEDDEAEDDDGDGRAKRIVRLNGMGQRVQDFTSPGRIRALALGLDQSIWMLGNKTLWHYARSGERLSSIELKTVTKDKAKLLAIDKLGVWLWMGANRQLIRVDGDAAGTSAVKLELPGKIELLAVDPRTGDIWAATEHALYRYADTATLKKTIEMKVVGLKDPKALAFDPANQTLWLGHDKGMSRFSPDGTKLFTVGTKEDIDSIGVLSFTLTPTIDIVAPIGEQASNEVLPLFRLKAGAQCNLATSTPIISPRNSMVKRSATSSPGLQARPRALIGRP